MKRGKVIFYNTMMLTAASLVMRTVQMAFQVYLSRQIGAAGIGLFQLIMSVSALAMTFGASGIRITAACLVAEEVGRGDYDRVRRIMNCCVGFTLTLSIAAGALLFLWSGFFAASWIGDVRAEVPLKIIAVTLPVMSLSSVAGGYFTATGRIKRHITIEVIERIIGIPAAIFLLTMVGSGNPGDACAAIIAGSFAGTVVAFLLSYMLYYLDQRKWPVKRQTAGFGAKGRGGRRRGAAASVVTTALPNAVNDYVRVGLSSVKNMLMPWGLKQWGQSGEGALASYGTIQGMAMPVIMFPSAILLSLTEILVPELAECRASGRKKRVQYMVSQVMRMGILFSMSVTVLLFCLADELGTVIYHSQEAAYFIRLFSPMATVLYLDILVDGMNKGLKYHVENMRNNTITSLLDVALLFVLLPRFGILGFFTGFVITRLINFLLSVLLLLKASDFYVSPIWLLKVAAGGITCFASSNWAHILLIGVEGPLHIAAHIAVIVTTYILFLAAFGAIKRSDIKWIANLMKP